MQTYIYTKLPSLFRDDMSYFKLADINFVIQFVRISVPITELFSSLHLNKKYEISVSNFVIN